MHCVMDEAPSLELFIAVTSKFQKCKTFLLHRVWSTSAEKARPEKSQPETLKLMLEKIKIHDLAWFWWWFRVADHSLTHSVIFWQTSMMALHNLLSCMQVTDKMQVADKMLK